VCFRCLEVKPLEDYDIGPSGKRRKSVCRVCVAAEPPKLRKRAKTWQRGGYARRDLFMDELLARRALRRFRAEGIGIGPDGRFVLVDRPTEPPCHGFRTAASAAAPADQHIASPTVI
jgi:hypothetical protein